MSDTLKSKPERIIRPERGIIGIDFKELWRYHELFGFLAWRDVMIRYKQTLIGVTWVAIQPLLMMVVFTVIFGKVARLSSGGTPYAVMTFSGLLPWYFFSNAISNSSNSVVSAANMISKIYFPRLIVPVSSTLSGVIDFIISTIILLGLMAGYHVEFRISLLLMPFFFLVEFLLALGIGFWLSALNVKYRDVKFVVPFLVQIGLYISPVGFSSSNIPAQWRFLYSLNPMVGVIDGFRWSIMGPEFAPYWPGLFISLIMVLFLLLSGALYFRKVERTFADVI